MNNSGMRCSTLKAGLLLGASLSLTLSGPTNAAQVDADGVDEGDRDVIVVTASKREENLQDVPSAVSAVSGQDLQDLGATDINDFVYKVPGLAFNRTDRSSNRIAIRGLSSFTSNPSEFPLVGAYVDETPISETSIPDIALVDLERIEVLRGPQGTLYGEGSMGGTIKYITAKPNSEKFEGFVNGEFSSVDNGGETYKANGAINLPLVKNVAALRLVALYEDGAGFIDNEATGEEDADDFERYGFRGALALTPTDALKVTLTGSYQKFEGGIPPIVYPEAIPGITPPGLMSPGEDVGFLVAPTFSEDEIVILNGVIEYDFGFATLTSATSYYDRVRDGSADEATTARIVEQGFAPLAGSIGITDFTADQGVRTTFENGNETFSQEIRLSSNGESRLNYTVGAYYRKRDIFQNNDTFSDDLADLNPTLLGFNVSANPDYDGFLQIARAAVEYTQFAVFGEATYDLTDRLAVTGGLRYFNEDVEGDQSIAVPDTALTSVGTTFFQPIVADFPLLETSDDDVLWKVGLAYKAMDDMLLYAQAATGFRPGGVNPRANPTPGADSPSFFSSDSVTSYEVGVKSQWWDQRLTVNLAGYYTDLEDGQFQDSRDPQFPVVRNSGGADVFGFEAEVLAVPSDGLTLGGNISVLSAEFSEDSLPVDDGMGGTIFIIAEGQQLPISRGVTASAFAEYVYPVTSSLDAFIYGDVSYAEGAPVNTVREETGTGFNFYTLDDYTLVNLQIGLQHENWRAALFLDNVTNEFIEVGGSPAFGIVRDQPQTLGVRLGASF